MSDFSSLRHIVRRRMWERKQKTDAITGVINDLVKGFDVLNALALQRDGGKATLIVEAGFVYLLAAPSRIKLGCACLCDGAGAVDPMGPLAETHESNVTPAKFLEHLAHWLGETCDIPEGMTDGE